MERSFYFYKTIGNSKNMFINRKRKNSENDGGLGGGRSADGGLDDGGCYLLEIRELRAWE